MKKWCDMCTDRLAKYKIVDSVCCQQCYNDMLDGVAKDYGFAPLHRQCPARFLQRTQKQALPVSLGVIKLN